MRWFYRASLVGGICALIGGVFWYVQNVRFVQKAEHASGVVVDLTRSEGDQDEADVYFPVVSFTTAEGETIQFESHSGSSSPPDVGDSVGVLYDPDNPHDAKLSSFFDLWGFPGILVLLGAIFTGVGWFVPRWFARKPSPETPSAAGA
jgi:hypothetical protein